MDGVQHEQALDDLAVALRDRLLSDLHP